MTWNGLYHLKKGDDWGMVNCFANVYGDFSIINGISWIFSRFLWNSMGCAVGFVGVLCGLMVFDLDAIELSKMVE